MKVLIDHNLPKKIRRYLPTHLVRTAAQEGCALLANGDLMKIAESRGFQVLITGDQNISYQQNNTQRSISMVVLTALKLSLIEPHAENIRAAVDRASPGSYEVVPIPLPQKSRPPRPQSPGDPSSSR